MSRRPVTILGGYLGAGKTTLVNNILRHAEGRRIAVLVNDFGTIGIDADLIIGAEAGLLSLAGGCICCSYGDDLVQALADLARRDPAPDCVIIEMSGVALPGAVAQSLTLLFDYRVDAVVVMADAETTLERLADRYMGDTLHRQFADADLIVVNKCDLVADAGAAIAAQLGDTFAQARILRTTNSALAPSVLFGIGTDAPRRGGMPVSPMPPHATVSVTFAGHVDLQRLATALNALDLVRVKGFARDASGAWQTLQLAGRRVAIEAAPAAVGPARLACIAVGSVIDQLAIVAALVASGASGVTPWPDGP